MTRDLGTLYANTSLGIFGQMPRETVGDAVEPVEVADRDQVAVGPATILSNIRGDEVEEFDIEIPDEAVEGIKTVGDIVKYIEDNQ